MSASKHILIGVTGSVATIKLPLIVQELQQRFTQNVEIRIVSTNAANHFIQDSELSNVDIFTDDMEWECWKRLSDPVLHIDLRNWADVLLIAPLDANTLAKISHGLCDNLLVIYM